MIAELSEITEDLCDYISSDVSESPVSPTDSIRDLLDASPSGYNRAAAILGDYVARTYDISHKEVRTVDTNITVQQAASLIYGRMALGVAA